MTLAELGIEALRGATPCTRARSAGARPGAGTGRATASGRSRTATTSCGSRPTSTTTPARRDPDADRERRRVARPGRRARRDRALRRPRRAQRRTADALPRVALSAEAFAIARQAWEALIAPEPNGLLAIPRSRELRFMDEAFIRLAQEYPWRRDGLSLTERRLLVAAARRSNASWPSTPRRRGRSSATRSPSRRSSGSPRCWRTTRAARPCCRRGDVHHRPLDRRRPHHPGDPLALGRGAGGHRPPMRWAEAVRRISLAIERLLGAAQRRRAAARARRRA